MGANESTTKRYSITLGKCDINRRERFFLPYCSFFEVIYPPPKFYEDGTRSNDEKVGGEYKVKNISKNIKLVHVQCTSLICQSTFITPDMTFYLTDECAKDHTTQVTVQIDISQEIVLPYFLKLDKKLLQSLKDGEGDNQIIALPGYNFLTFKCLITKTAGFYELFIENLIYDIKINGHVKNYLVKLVVGDDEEQYFTYKLDFSFNPDVVRQQNSETQRASDLATRRFPTAVHVEVGENPNSAEWINLNSNGAAVAQHEQYGTTDIGEEAKPTSDGGIYETVVADSAMAASHEGLATSNPPSEFGSNSSSTTGAQNGQKSFQDTFKAFSNGLKELLSFNPLPPVYTVSSPDLMPETTPAATDVPIQLQPPPIPSPQFPKKLIATLIQKEKYFSKILAETKYTDAILINQSGEKVAGFRCFLAHISPVFKAIFDTNPELPVKIEVGNFKEETLQQIIQFSQGAEFEVNENVMELLEFAKTFSINLLIDRCYTWIANNINEKNICQYIKFAYSEDHSVLKKKCLEFLKNNKLSVDPESIKSLPQEILFDAFFS
jgi:hypothetical protein